MRRLLLAGLAGVVCALLLRAEPAAAGALATTIDLDYTYSQADLDNDVNASTLFNQKYEIKYESALNASYDFLGAVRLDLQNGWYTDAAGTAKVAPTLEMEAKGSQADVKFAYEAIVNTTDSYRETGEVKATSTSLSLDAQVTPQLWPEMKLRFQRRRDYEDFSKDSTTNSVEFSAKKDIYGLLLEYNFRREDVDTTMPTLVGSTETKWSSKATYKNVLWGGTEFELAYEINETYKDENARGIFSGDTETFTQSLRTRFRNTLLIAPRLTLNAAWEYQFDQDLLQLDYDYKVKNKYALDIRWDAYPWLKFTSEIRRETEKTASAPGVDDLDTVTDTFKGAFDLTAVPWMLISGKAEFRTDDKIAADTGGSVDATSEEKYELIAKNKIGDFWDFTWDATSSVKHTDDWLTSRETKIKGDLKLKILDLVVSPGYEVSRVNTWERPFDYATAQEQIRSATIKFEYQMQLLDLFKATFSHQYGVKVDDALDAVLNFERTLQFDEDTRLNVVLAEIVRDLRLEGEVDRTASDTEGDADPELVELAYTLKLDWKYENLSILSSFKYNDKGNTFDDVSFNAKATWKGERLEISGEYQFDKIIKDVTEPKDEKRKLNLKLNYRF
jgi:hypothetical protein